MVTCPNCGKTNRCNCESCNPNGDKKNLIIIDKVNDLYQCCFCNHKFDEGDSMDYDWDRMVAEIVKKVSAVDCINWLEYRFNTAGRGRNRASTEYKNNNKFTEFEYEKAVYGHFKMGHRAVMKKDLIRFKRQIKLQDIIGS